MRCVQNRARLVRARYERLDRMEAAPVTGPFDLSRSVSDWHPIRWAGPDVTSSPPVTTKVTYGDALPSHLTCTTVSARTTRLPETVL